MLRCNFGIILIKKFLLIFMLCFSIPLLAADENMYNVIVPVQNQSIEARTDAFAQGLQTVADRLNATLPEDQQPEHYIESYSYVTDPDQSDVLEINILFDQQALKSFLPKQQALQSQILFLHVTDIANLVDLNTLMENVKHLHGVQSVFIQRVKDDQVDMQIAYQGNQAVLIQALLSNQHLVSTATEDTTNSSQLHFKWMSS